MADEETNTDSQTPPETPDASAAVAEEAPADAAPESEAAAPEAAAGEADSAAGEASADTEASPADAEESAATLDDTDMSLDDEEAPQEDPLADLSDEVRRILRLQVPVIVKLADKQMPLGEIVDLSPGSIVEFSRSSDQALDLLVNNKVVGRGVAVKVGEKFGLRIDEICPVEETIRKLGR